MRSELSLDLSSPTTMPLEMRMAEFKQDPKKMDEMAKFVDGVLIRAQSEVEQKLDNKMKMEKQSSKEEDPSNVLLGFKRGRIVNRARGMVLRLFEAICNCTNTGPIPIPTSRTRSAPPPTSKY